MNLKSPLLVVKDMDAAKAFYAEVLGLSAEQDFGENVTLTGGLSLQTEASWNEFLSAEKISFGGCDAEIAERMDIPLEIVTEELQQR